VEWGVWQLPVWKPWASVAGVSLLGDLSRVLVEQALRMLVSEGFGGKSEVRFGGGGRNEIWI